MRHRPASRRLSQLLDGTLPAPTERAVREHAGSCPACAERLAEFEACERLLARLPCGLIPFAASAADEQRLRGLARWAFEQAPRRRAGPEVTALALAAAAVACVVALTGTSRWVPNTETTGVTATQLAFVVPAAWRGR
jgi:anti-sigma factor RsiW